MPRLQVQCVKKTGDADVQSFITAMGGVHEGVRWMHYAEEAIENMENNDCNYYAVIEGTEADVITGFHDGVQYLKTRRDGLRPDDLLTLPECM